MLKKCYKHRAMVHHYPVNVQMYFILQQTVLQDTSSHLRPVQLVLNVKKAHTSQNLCKGHA